MTEYEEVPFEYPEKPESSEHEYFGDGWSVRQEQDRFVFAYLSGEVVSKEKEVEISQEDYLAAREGKLGFDELCIKYKVS